MKPRPRDLSLDEVVDHFTLVGDEVDQLRNKAGGTRLGFALTLKFLLWQGRFPRGRHELANDAVAHVARQVGVAAGEFGSYDMAGRTAQRHRTEIRRYTGFRECSVVDAEKLTFWLASHVAEAERREDRVREDLLARCRGELIEPPSADRVTEIVRSALRQAEQTLVTRVAARLDPGAIGRLEALVGLEDEAVDRPDALAIKSDPGKVSLDSLLAEIAKLSAVRAVALQANLFTDVAPKVVAGWRARAAVESPSHLRDHPQPTRLVLLSALLFEREREITDALVELLISTVHRIDARAEKKVVKEFVKDFRRVTGKASSTFTRDEELGWGPTPCCATSPRPPWTRPTTPSATSSTPSSGGRRRCGTWSPSTGPAARSTSATSAGCSSPPTRTTTAVASTPSPSGWPWPRPAAWDTPSSSSSCSPMRSAAGRRLRPTAGPAPPVSMRP